MPRDARQFRDERAVRDRRVREYLRANPYTAYSEAELRERLGVDTVSLPWNSATPINRVRYDQKVDDGTKYYYAKPAWGIWSALVIVALAAGVWIGGPALPAWVPFYVRYFCAGLPAASVYWLYSWTFHHWWSRPEPATRPPEGG